MLSTALGCIAATGLLLISIVSAFAQRSCASTNCTGPLGKWHANRENVIQSAEVTSSSNSVGIGIQIQSQDRVPSGSPGAPGGVIQEQPKGPQHLSGPGISVPGWTNPGSPPDPVLPLDG